MNRKHSHNATENRIEGETTKAMAPSPQPPAHSPTQPPSHPPIHHPPPPFRDVPHYCSYSIINVCFKMPPGSLCSTIVELHLIIIMRINAHSHTAAHTHSYTHSPTLLQSQKKTQKKTPMHKHPDVYMSRVHLNALLGSEGHRGV